MDNNYKDELIKQKIQEKCKSCLCKDCSNKLNCDSWQCLICHTFMRPLTYCKKRSI